MFSATRGFSTIECLIALLVFSIGALGSVGTVALSLRTAQEGTAATAVARRAASVLDSLRAAVASPGAPCSGVTAGAVTTTAGEVRWQLAPATGGRLIDLQASYPTVRGLRVDSLRGYLRCE